MNIPTLNTEFADLCDLELRYDILASSKRKKIFYYDVISQTASHSLQWCSTTDTVKSFFVDFKDFVSVKITQTRGIVVFFLHYTYVFIPYLQQEGVFVTAVVGLHYCLRCLDYAGRFLVFHNFLPGIIFYTASTEIIITSCRVTFDYFALFGL